MRQVGCSEYLLAGGEGRTVDYLLANSQFTAIVRHPGASATQVGLDGGTLIDLAPVGYQDRLQEAVPLVGGGWLDVDSFELGDDRITVGGTVQSLPDLPVAEGARAEVSWVIRPDDPWLYLEGADGLWLHTRGDFTRYGELLLQEITMVSTDGVIAQDLGGALRIDGVSRILMDRARHGWSRNYPGGQPLNGVAEAASRVVFSAQGQRLGHLNLIAGGAFAQRIPQRVDAVRAEAPGRAPGAWVAPGQDLQLRTGAPGAIELRLSDARVPVRVAWSDQAGRAGRRWLPPEGGTLVLGAGSYDLTLRSGPTGVGVQRSLTVGTRETVRLRASVPPAFSPQRWVPIGTHPADRARSWRGSDRQAQDAAVADGLRYVVLTAEDDVPAVERAEDIAPWLVTRNGVRTTTPWGEVLAWPLGAPARRAGHGAPLVRDSDLPTAIELIRGSPDAGRFLAVSLGVLDALGAPWQTKPPPELVQLDSAPDIDDPWPAWTHWLDAGVGVLPMGPVTWVKVEDPDVVGALDVDRGLRRGWVAAGTGPLLTLEMAAPDALPSRFPPQVVVRLRAAAGSLDSLTLVGPDGVLAQWSVDALPQRQQLEINPGSETGWLLAIATGPEDWAVSRPLWPRAPL